jgi:hypothetical protein
MSVVSDIVRKPFTDIVPKNMPEWVPVIFANGEDDDTPGLIALFTNEKVQLDETIYKPGEAVTIVARRLVVTHSFKIVYSDGSISFFVRTDEEPHMTCHAPLSGRPVTITDSNFHFQG